jgi:hypothetical protein
VFSIAAIRIRPGKSEHEIPGREVIPCPLSTKKKAL